MHYYQCSLQLDGTFIKSTFGEVILAACFNNGNNNIMIVKITIIVTESAEN
jgi:hypothetical protein